MEWFIERTVLFAESLLCRAFVIGWCAEILQAGFLIADDIMDNAEKRRGKDAWYKIPSVWTIYNNSIIDWII